MSPLVSILIPAYNAEKWIADTIRSALGQTWPKKEIIIVDDGSTDQTLAIARQFASQEVCVFTQPNQGASAARKKAYSLCQGGYVQWLDADDLLRAEKIARQMAVLERLSSNRTLPSSGWGYFMYRLRKTVFCPSALWCDLSPVEWQVRKMEQNLHMPLMTWLVSRELCQAAGPWDTRLSLDDDGEYFCRVVLASDGIRFVPEAEVYYRRSGTSTMSAVDWSNKKLDSQALSMQLQIAHLRAAEDSDRVRAACLTYLHNWLHCFYPERMDIVGQLAQTAADLGGELKEPRLPWKYVWIQKLFGWESAKRARILLPRLRLSLIRSWDKALFERENRNLASEPGT
jgi:glycosyltransferase involved in cell wall biosynthesis